MSTQGTVKRYILLIQKISYGAHPSFNDLKEYLEDQGFNISPRTLQRDIEQIRNEFSIEIKYNRIKNGYTLAEEDGMPPASLVRFLEIMSTAELLSENLKDGNELLQFISFEAQGNLKGIEYLSTLLPAIQKRRKIEFTHENFDTGLRKKYLLQPYLLKEYQNRWYLFGTIGSTNSFRTFGLDRIGDLIIKTETFRPLRGIEPKSYFEDLVGLNYSETDVEEVLLKTDKVQAKYLTTLPLHKSQTVVSEKGNEVVLRLFVRPNYELKQRIFMLLDRVRVMKPKWLVDEIKCDLKNTLKKYGN
jgi:predicted DNA-binding transcriptional regulator YafY